jgi:hypothetical protein
VAGKIEAVNLLRMWRRIGDFWRSTRERARPYRTLNAVLVGVEASLRSFGNVAHQLWHEVMGSLFLAMAFFGGVAAVREYTKYQAGHTTAGRVAIALAFTLTFAWFGLSSFWRVRRRRG